MPKCPWRFGEECDCRDFITPDNRGVKQLAESLRGKDADETIEKVAAWIVPSITYPVDNKGNPCASAMQRRHQACWLRWGSSIYNPYIWAYPNETLALGRGICIDTSTLFVSLLQALDIPARVVLGELRTVKEDVLVGYHAWSKVFYRGDEYSAETTVEEAGRNILFPVGSTYQRYSEWAKSRGVYYVAQDEFDQRDYIANAAGGQPGYPILELIGLPVSLVIKEGMCKTKALAGMGIEAAVMPVKPNVRQVERAWQKDELRARQVIREAYGA
jgi:hypothetical protein